MYSAVINIPKYYLFFCILYFLFLPLKKLKYISMREYLEYKNNNNIPIYGGILIILTLMPFCRSIIYVALLLYGIIGFIDDMLKQYKKKFSEKNKIIVQSVAAFIIMYFLYSSEFINIPFYGRMYLHRVFIYLFYYSTIIGLVNGVNIADGMDGLSGKNIFNLSIVLGIISIHQRQDEISNIIFALSGSILGYLTFNNHKAKIIMGDTGALGMGGMIAVISILLKCEWIILVSGAYFVIAPMSCLLQRISIKYLGKRMFSISPIHHAFEKKYQYSLVVDSINLFSIVMSSIAIVIYYWNI